ncbi:hypothetical protein LPTSP3_g31930 [Leptospira kobayashii]|uniref:Uncharacterized protein n=1 Tax=Leptospira kobayashii TaxID=1917830 RepID=A0ABN6KGC3_9LEPT|nr:hypothetical protein [Leptospira kobayashii]BDA80263.1 hypothetical protein LPTSP3_g31930 [Leptospira kobayashii]
MNNKAVLVVAILMLTTVNLYPKETCIIGLRAPDGSPAKFQIIEHSSSKVLAISNNKGAATIIYDSPAMLETLLVEIKLDILTAKIYALPIKLRDSFYPDAYCGKWLDLNFN